MKTKPDSVSGCLAGISTSFAEVYVIQQPWKFQAKSLLFFLPHYIINILLSDEHSANFIQCGAMSSAAIGGTYFSLQDAFDTILYLGKTTGIFFSLEEAIADQRADIPPSENAQALVSNITPVYDENAN
jgi:hypothetical protein